MSASEETLSWLLDIIENDPDPYVRLVLYFVVVGNVTNTLLILFNWPIFKSHSKLAGC